jgi:hypothetical protein
VAQSLASRPVGSGGSPTNGEGDRGQASKVDDDDVIDAEFDRSS